LKRIRKITLILTASLTTIYLLLFFFPQIVFKDKIEYKSFIIYSHSQPEKNIFSILDTVENLISHSEFYKNQKGKYKIFLCQNFFEYSFFAPTERHAFASNNLLTNNIVLSKSSISGNKVERNGTENNHRTLSGTIAHEVTHTLIKTRIGLTKYMQLDNWKNEGYADFIAKESSFNFLIGTYFLCNSQTPSSLSFQYFKYRLYVGYLIRDKKITFTKIINDRFNLKELDSEIQKKYCQ
jgi:hypothetical protein